MKWVSWINVLLGAWLFVAPWAIGFSGAGAVEDHAAGLTVLLVAIASAAVPQNVDTLGIVNLLAGVWIAAWPVVFANVFLHGEASTDVGIGLLITLLAAVRIGSARRLPGQRVMD